MANENEEIVELRQRVEALEELVVLLRGRIEILEAHGAVDEPGFHMGVQEPTI